ncbi:MAG: hypothetical protein M3Y39_18415, partial [Chloroflexota bacterium]|nr:hypothetical protein [Chloroflexota bacterium]
RRSEAALMIVRLVCLMDRVVIRERGAKDRCFTGVAALGKIEVSSLVQLTRKPLRKEFVLL